jgi:hypothetical protein
MSAIVHEEPKDAMLMIASCINTFFEELQKENPRIVRTGSLGFTTHIQEDRGTMVKKRWLLPDKIVRNLEPVMDIKNGWSFMGGVPHKVEIRVPKESKYWLQKAEELCELVKYNIDANCHIYKCEPDCIYSEPDCGA